MQLRSGVEVAVLQASGYSSDWTPSLGIFIRCGRSPKKTKDSLSMWGKLWFLLPVTALPPAPLCIYGPSRASLRRSSSAEAGRAPSEPVTPYARRTCPGQASNTRPLCLKVLIGFEQSCSQPSRPELLRSYMRFIQIPKLLFGTISGCP